MKSRCEIAAQKKVSIRDMSTRPAGEVARRLLYIAYFVCGLAGGGLLIAAAAQKRAAFGIIGALLLAFGFLLHFLGRKRFGFAGLADEIRKNPFKRAAPDKEPDGTT